MNKCCFAYAKLATLFFFQGLREEVGSLNNKIQDLEAQNRALASMLVHQLRSEASPGSPKALENFTSQWTIEEERRNDNNLNKEISKDASSPSPNLLQTIPNVKHCNSFNSEILEHSPLSDTCDNSLAITSEKRLSADMARILGEYFHDLKQKDGPRWKSH